MSMRKYFETLVSFPNTEITDAGLLRCSFVCPRFFYNKLSMLCERLIMLYIFNANTSTADTFSQ